MIFPLVCLFLFVGVQAYRPNEMSSFFLKAPKSVPRAGRSAPGYDGFFLKSTKNVPRIGRRDGHTAFTDDSQWYGDLDKPGMQIDDKWSIENADLYEPYEFNDGNAPHRTRRFNMAPYSSDERSKESANQ